jgi:hypothetical protein
MQRWQQVQEQHLELPGAHLLQGGYDPETFISFLIWIVDICPHIVVQSSGALRSDNLHLSGKTLQVPLTTRNRFRSYNYGQHLSSRVTQTRSRRFPQTLRLSGMYAIKHSLKMFHRYCLFGFQKAQLVSLSHSSLGNGREVSKKDVCARLTVWDKVPSYWWALEGDPQVSFYDSLRPSETQGQVRSRSHLVHLWGVSGPRALPAHP